MQSLRHSRYLSLLLGAVILPSVAHAQISFGSTIVEYASNLYKWSIGVGLSLAIIMIIYAGYIMITSTGNTSRIGFAKEVIMGSLQGVALLAAARLVLNLLSTK